MDAGSRHLILFVFISSLIGFINNLFQPLIKIKLLIPILFILLVICIISAAVYFKSKRSRAINPSHVLTKRISAKSLLYGLILTFVFGSFFAVQKISNDLSLDTPEWYINIIKIIADYLDPPPEWYKHVVSQAETALVELHSVNADTRCPKGLENIKILYDEANSMNKERKYQSASRGYEKFTKEANKLSGLLKTFDEIIRNAREREKEIKEMLKKSHKHNYESYLQMAKEARATAAAYAKTRDLRERLAEADKIVELANNNALQEEYNESTSYLMDAIDEFHIIEYTGGRYKYPFPRIDRGIPISNRQPIVNPEELYQKLGINTICGDTLIIAPAKTL